MKNVSPWIWVATGVVLLLAAALAYKTFGKPREAPSGESGSAPQGSNANTAQPPASEGANTATNMYARYGDRGNKISALQSYLVKRGQNIAVDGIFGPKTQQAVRSVFGTSDVTANQWQNRRQ